MFKTWLPTSFIGDHEKVTLPNIGRLAVFSGVSKVTQASRVSVGAIAGVSVAAISCVAGASAADFDTPIGAQGCSIHREGRDSPTKRR
jgi:hypothetical protein